MRRGGGTPRWDKGLSLQDLMEAYFNPVGWWRLGMEEAAVKP
jgi:hypothetical protein